MVVKDIAGFDVETDEFLGFVAYVSDAKTLALKEGRKVAVFKYLKMVGD